MLKGVEVIEFAHIAAKPVQGFEAMHRDHQTLARNVVLHVPHSRVGETSTTVRAVKIFAHSGVGGVRGAGLPGAYP